ncbi:hypothetical protein [Klebsiella variicola]|uniref:hypothetical protein n=1 Tax=Klebsiella variicola TaxID=244366 RepID=UPI0010847E87|nr:hypothetical protein [Klebsiella variicola]VFZ87322.1 Uncharacterised protein [Klebsiella variicola]HDX8858940.1 hypothetical protein [Klebsiella michiganensis]
MATLVNSGRAAVARSIKESSVHLAWGSGSVDWDASKPVESVSALNLVAEVGRRKVTQAMFCKPDSAGEIVVSEGRFALSTEPTQYLYMRFAFDFVDAEDEIIRELGVFVGTVAKDTVPVGQEYLLPEEVEEPGTLLVLENIEKLVRSPQIRQQFEFVVQF